MRAVASCSRTCARRGHSTSAIRCAPRTRGREAGEAMVVLGEIETADRVPAHRARARSDQRSRLRSPARDRRAQRSGGRRRDHRGRARRSRRSVRAATTARRKAELVARRAAQHRRVPPSCGTITSAASIARCGTGSRRGSSSRSAPRRSRPRASSTLARRRRDGRQAVPGRARGARATRRPRRRARHTSGSSSAGSRCARKDLEAAANHLEEASQSRADVARDRRDARRGLREPRVPRWPDAPQGGRAVRRARSPAGCATRDDQTGINYLRRAVGVDPYSKGIVAGARGGARRARSQWDELDRILRHRSAVVQDPDERARGPAPARRAVPQPARRTATG